MMYMYNRGSCRKACNHNVLPRNEFVSLHPHISVSFQYFKKLFHTLTLRYMISISTEQFLFILLQYRIMSLQSWAFVQFSWSTLPLLSKGQLSLSPNVRTAGSTFNRKSQFVLHAARGGPPLGNFF